MTNDKETVWTKIGFQQTVEDVIKHGPSARVGIGPRVSTEPVIQALAQIDTGAAGCGISPRLSKRLNLDPIDTGEIHEAGREPITTSIFSVRLFTPVMDIELDVAGLPSLAPPHDILIGRDILARFRLLVDFTNGVTQLHFKNDP